MKIGMLGIINNLSTRVYSHNAGWTLVTKKILSDYYRQEVDVVSNTDDFDQYDILIINEGVNFKPGSFNFFGGASNRQVKALKKLSSYYGRLLSLNHPVDYSIPCKKRKDLEECRDLKFPKCDVLDLTTLSDSIIIGDSHSISAFKPGRTIKRMDGKTLHGALKVGLENLIPHGQKDVQFYFGNIDVRFHFHRFGGLRSVREILEEFRNQVTDLHHKGYKITLTHLIPPEDESRKIPSTGKYKGQNFFGSKAYRARYVLYFNFILDLIAKDLGLEVEKWHHLKIIDELSFDDMESRQSVHLRPSSYMYFKEITS